ncbi:hypothetical protein pb186bvf_004080 [Paramecium bursaria]
MYNDIVSLLSIVYTYQSVTVKYYSNSLTTFTLNSYPQILKNPSLSDFQ